MSNDQVIELRDEDGLTAHEREYLTTPMHKLTPDQRMMAIAIREKRDNHRWEQNARAREEEKKARELAA